MNPGFYPADLETTPLTVATVIYSGCVKTDPATLLPLTSHGGPVALVNMNATNGSIVVTLGTYNPAAGAGTRFTVDKIISTATAGAVTAGVWPLFLVPVSKALKIQLTAGTGYIRTQGKVAVVPA